MACTSLTHMISVTWVAKCNAYHPSTPRHLTIHARGGGEERKSRKRAPLFVLFRNEVPPLNVSLTYVRAYVVRAAARPRMSRGTAHATPQSSKVPTHHLLFGAYKYSILLCASPQKNTGINFPLLRNYYSTESHGDFFRFALQLSLPPLLVPRVLSPVWIRVRPKPGNEPLAEPPPVRRLGRPVSIG